jgi:uncharacterized membrane protein YphA (DoxX/SURF4 family)
MKRAAIIILRLLLGGFFVAAGLSKVGSPLGTLAAVYSYQIVVPDLMAEMIASALPWMEILVGLAVIFGLWLPVALGWLAALLCAFTALTAQAWWRELDIDCGCLDLSVLHPSLAVLSTPAGAALRNLVLLALAAVLAALVRRGR